ncbi:hypothetical protein E8A73_038515 [Polyangium aurulentum]|nr:hypothetical protein [Polyangium aurulentum]UQA57144.1 hypothetical protein E8A73_038515 [Polyangium aurulentum]
MALGRVEHGDQAGSLLELGSALGVVDEHVLGRERAALLDDVPCSFFRLDLERGHLVLVRRAANVKGTAKTV